MKIKTKKQLNLPQLIEWAMENEIKERLFLSENYCVGLDRHGYIYFNSQVTIPLDQTFTVEVEEEITEDTKISILAHYSIYGFKRTKNCTSINDVKDDNSIAFYIMNHDRTMTLIWRDGSFVE
ncbi:hypothetical protein QI193_02800 [Staphylococcus saprophyticus]|nr:hypothetical protein [Staphylococcus saprophyticus]